MYMMAYHRSDDITIDLMTATIDMNTGLLISLIQLYKVYFRAMHLLEEIEVFWINFQYERNQKFSKI